ncbi:hypothetical protein MMC07_000868 [Pseudocyphellaria aurata]|nr:hypothetical protein [Pseudocyphellaria aurata]
MKHDIAVWISLGGLLSESVFARPHYPVHSHRALPSDQLDEPLAVRETLSSAMTEHGLQPRAAGVGDIDRVNVNGVTDIGVKVSES